MTPFGKFAFSVAALAVGVPNLDAAIAQAMEPPSGPTRISILAQIGAPQNSEAARIVTAATVIGIVGGAMIGAALRPQDYRQVPDPKRAP